MPLQNLDNNKNQEQGKWLKTARYLALLYFIP